MRGKKKGWYGKSLKKLPRIRVKWAKKMFVLIMLVDDDKEMGKTCRCMFYVGTDEQSPATTPKIVPNTLI